MYCKLIMRKCLYCNYRYQKDSNISFHKFPTDINLRTKWLQNMKVSHNNLNISQNDSLCSQHFEDQCFNENNCRRSLRGGSVPTIFEGCKFEVSEVEATNNIVLDSNLTNVKVNELKHGNKQTEIQLKELKPASSCYVYNPATHTLTVTENKTSSPSQHGGNKFSKVTTFRESNMKSASKNGHDYGTSKTSMKSRYQYSVAHDHQYENKNALERKKQILQGSTVRRKVVNQRVKRLKTKVGSLKTVIRDLNTRIKRMYANVGFL